MTPPIKATDNYQIMTISPYFRDTGKHSKSTRALLLYYDIKSRADDTDVDTSFTTRVTIL